MANEIGNAMEMQREETDRNLQVIPSSPYVHSDTESLRSKD